jgi:hypothetical protein
MKHYYYEDTTIRPRIICNDGVSLSIQASQYAYSTPRQKLQKPWDFYMSVEVGYIFDAAGEKMLPPELWRSYRDGDCHVWGYVPTRMVKEFIEQHGGEKEVKDWDGKMEVLRISKNL